MPGLVPLGPMPLCITIAQSGPHEYATLGPTCPRLLKFRAPESDRQSMPVLRFDDVRMGFGPHSILRGIDLSVGAGETVGILGENGAGKSTLLRLGAGLLRPSRGRVGVLDGTAIDARKQGWVGWCHTRGFVRRVSLRSNLELEASFRRSPSRDLAPRLDALADDFGVSRWLDTPSERCSSGVLQRARLLQVVLASPRIALLDEPMRGVDGGSRPALARQLRRQLGGAACLWVSHSRDELEGVADKILTLHDGRLHAGPARAPIDA